MENNSPGYEMQEMAKIVERNVNTLLNRKKEDRKRGIYPRRL